MALEELGVDDVAAGIGEGARRELGQGVGVVGGGVAKAHRNRVVRPGRDRPPQASQERAVLTIQAGGVQGPDHVGSALDGAGEGLVPSESGDTAVVTGEQGGVDLVVSPPGGAGVDGVLQQAGDSVGLLDQGLGVAQHPGQEPGDGLDHDNGGDLSPVEHVVADAQLAHLDAAGGVVLGHARVDALVAAAGED